MASLHTTWVRFLVLAAALTGCGGNQSFESTLDEMWQWDGGVEASHVIERLQSASAPKVVPAAVGVTGRGLVGRTLPAGKLWTYEGEVDVLPTLTGGLVLFTGAGKVVAIDVATGVKKFSLDTNSRRLEGAGFDGKYAVLLLVDKDDAREDQILVVGPKGEKLYEAQANARLGTPAVVDGLALVPYSGQYVGALDIQTTEHVGRVLIRDGIHSVSSEPGGVVVYGTGATLLSENVTSSPGSQSLKLDPKKLPGEPEWPIDGSKPRPARGRPVGLYAHVAPSELTLKLSTGGYVATYYDVAVGFEHGSNDIRFSTHFPRAVAGGAAGKHGPTLCLENGSLVRVNAKTGHHIPFGSLESKIKACVVSAPDDQIPKGARPSVLEQLEETISSTGPDMVAIQTVLLRELGEADTPDTTRSLLAIAQDPLVSLDLARTAGNLLAQRKTGGEVMIEALNASAPQPLVPDANEPAAPETDPSGSAKANSDDEWSDSPEDADKQPNGKSPQPSGEPDTKPPSRENPQDEPAIEPGAQRREKQRPPPVGSLARALLRMKTPGAARALAPYLNDPSSRAKASLNLMKTISKLGTGDPVEMREVSRFLYHYKNTGGEGQLIDALVLAAHFLFKYGDDEADEQLERALGQSLTHPDLTRGLEKNPPPPDDEKGRSEKPEGDNAGDAQPGDGKPGDDKRRNDKSVRPPEKGKTPKK